MTTLTLGRRQPSVSPVTQASISPIPVTSFQTTPEVPTHFYMPTLIGIALEREMKAKVAAGNWQSTALRAGLTPSMMESIFYGRYELGVAEMHRILDVFGINPATMYARLNNYVREISINRNGVIIYSTITPVTDKTPRSLIEALLHGKGSLYQKESNLLTRGYSPFREATRN